MNKIVWKYLALTVAILMATVSVSGCVSYVSLSKEYQPVAESDNFKFTEKHVEVYRSITRNYYYTNFCNQYTSIVQGMLVDIYGVTKNYSSPDAYATAMISAYEDLIEAEVCTTVKRYLAYCEGAMEAGLYEQYKADAAADVDAYIQNLKDDAESLHITFDQYLKQDFGNGITQAEIRTAMEYSYISSKYAEKLFEQESDKVTAEQINGYVDENKDIFYTSTITYYQVPSEDMLEQISECKTAEEVKIYLVDYYMNQTFEDQYRNQITDSGIEDSDKDQTQTDIRTTLLALNGIGDAEAVFTENDTDAYKAACYTIANAINSTLVPQVTKVSESPQRYTDPQAATDLGKWLFGDSTRKVGDTIVINDPRANSHTWYAVKEHMTLDTEKTRDMYYVLLDSEQKADNFWTALNAEKTPEKFAELIAEYIPGLSGEVTKRLSYETVKSANESMAEWLFADGRLEGDLFKGENKDKDGKVSGYFVAYFVRENEETWKLAAREAIASEAYAAWYEDAVARFHVTISYEPETATSSDYSTSFDPNGDFS